MKLETTNILHPLWSTSLSVKKNTATNINAL